MTTKELIELLQTEDPSGEMEVARIGFGGGYEPVQGGDRFEVCYTADPEAAPKTIFVLE